MAVYQREQHSEALRIDGNEKWRTILNIIWPLMNFPFRAPWCSLFNTDGT